ncbi:TPA: alpha/beta hydrolase [Burkholderia cenocepacia]|nr:alpha/beta hydrolase [Burkholderia cenocepacia]
MATFVLVHGAWIGGWCWRDTAAQLRQAGHTVFTPTLSGLGEHAHQSSPDITLETHIRDVCGCLEAEELTDIVLCGHSYGGCVITGVADRMSDRIRSLVYVDAFVPQDGQALNDLLPICLGPEGAAPLLNEFRSTAEASNGLMAPIPAEACGVSPEKQDWVTRRCVPQALATFEIPIRLTGAGKKIEKRLYILADAWDPSPFRYFAGQFASQSNWKVITMQCGHCVMVDLPGELASELMAFAN